MTMDHDDTPIAGPVTTARVESRRVALIVLGMHRTGTSAVTGVLRLLGAAAPKQLMAPRPFNAKGNWESPAVIRLNDRILQAGGSHWRDWSPFDERRIPPDAVAELEAQAADTLAAEFGGERLILLKDPRMCRVMPFWRGVLERAGFEARIVIPVRSPLDAALSLLDRNRIPIEEGMLLWLRHVLDAERATRDLARCFVSFAGLLEDWRGTAARMSGALRIEWPVSSSTASSEIDGFLSSQLRHHQNPRQDPRLRDAGFDWLPATYDVLLSLCSGQQATDALERLDSIHDAFDEPSRMLGPLFLRLGLGLQASTDAFKRHRRRALHELVRARVALYEARKANREMQRSFSWRALAPARALRTAFGPSQHRNIGPGSQHEADLAQLIAESGLFDPVWYREAHEDARSSGIDPAIHYLRIGAALDRDPSPLFCTAAYKRRYPDVAAAGLNPLVHFLEFGLKENRHIDPVSDAGQDNI